MKIVVTGATGFLGKHVMQELKLREFSVKYTTRTIEKKIDTFGDCEPIELDIYQASKNVYKKLGCPDVILHLAWGGLPNYKALSHFSKELISQYNFLSNLVKEGLPSLVSTGTCLEYGMQEGELNPEMDTNPTTPYGFAKDVLRKQLQFLQVEKSFKFTWVRLFYMYGQGQADASLFTSISRAVERGEKIFKISKGDQSRDFLPVEIVAKYLVDLTLSNESRGVINVCSGKPVSILDLIQQWKEKYNWEIELETGHYPYPDYEPFSFWGKNQLTETY